MIQFVRFHWLAVNINCLPVPWSETTRNRRRPFSYRYVYLPVRADGSLIASFPFSSVNERLFPSME